LEDEKRRRSSLRNVVGVEGRTGAIQRRTAAVDKERGCGSIVAKEQVKCCHRGALGDGDETAVVHDEVVCDRQIDDASANPFKQCEIAA
jgi:hypothetical protein